MTTVAWMLSRMVLLRFVPIFCGVTIFVVSLETMAHVDEILAVNDNRLSALLDYAVLRAPGVASLFMAISALLALLLTLIELNYRNELPAIWSTGTSPLHVAFMLVPVSAILGGINYFIDDQAVPRVAPVLYEWGIGDYGKKKLRIGENDPIWMRAGDDILRVSNANDQATELEDVTIFRRAKNGLLIEQIMAKTAVLRDGRWLLNGVVIYHQENLLPTRLKSMVYSGAIRPAAAGVRSGDPEEMSLGELGYFIANSGFGVRPGHVYETWWHKRLTLAITPWLMIFVCVPLAVKFRRGAGVGLLFGSGLAVGFGFFIFQGIALTFGELGFAPAWMAAWLPVLVVFAIGCALTMRAETVS